MSVTSKLSMPYLMAAQAQKHVTHNEALRTLDAVVQLCVLDQDLVFPPSSSAEGDRYIIGAGAIGEWQRHDGEIAAWQDGTWMFYQPQKGWLCWLSDENRLLVHDGTNWNVVSGRSIGDGSEGGLPKAVQKYYVRTDGSDNNAGLANNAGNAFRTVQKAIDVVTNLDLGGSAVTIHMASGTYADPVILKSYAGVGPITVRGNATRPRSVIISTQSSPAISAVGVQGKWIIDGVKITTKIKGDGIVVTKGSILDFKNIDCGKIAAGYSHFSVYDSAFVDAIGNYQITGNAAYHVASHTSGKFSCQGRNVKLIGRRIFSSFVMVQLVSSQLWFGTVFSGRALGLRYKVETNSVLYTGGSATHMPGSTAGTTATGGQYI